MWTTDATIAVDGQRLRVVSREGDGSQPPLLLFAGFASSVEVLEPFAAALRPQTSVVAFDVPGVGRSPTPSKPYRLSWVAGVVARALDALGHAEVDVLGVSWGGALAQQFAHQEPSRCRRLILVSTGPATILRPSSSMLRPFVGGRRPSAGELFGGKVRTEPGVARVLQRRVGGDGRGRLFQQLAVVGWTSVPFLRSIAQPTLVLAGDDDPLVPMVNSRILCSLLPSARLEVFHDGHLGLLTSPDEIAPVVEDFRDEVS